MTRGGAHSSQATGNNGLIQKPADTPRQPYSGMGRTPAFRIGFAAVSGEIQNPGSRLSNVKAVGKALMGVRGFGVGLAQVFGFPRDPWTSGFLYNASREIAFFCADFDIVILICAEFHTLGFIG